MCFGNCRSGLEDVDLDLGMQKVGESVDFCENEKEPNVAGTVVPRPGK
jgi:hypothetical protein